MKSADFYIDTDYRVLHEDESILVLDKPAPLAVHPVGSYQDNNLHSLLMSDPERAGQKINFTHRLDAETSGVILAAKTSEAASYIGKEFLAGRVKKKYRALVFGRPAQDAGEISCRLGNDKSSGFQTVRVADEVNGEEALTRYQVLSTHENIGEEKAVYSWLELEPLTGRTHQLRIHLALLGHPIVGDKIYVDLSFFQRYVMSGLDEAMLKRLKLPRLALHASSLSFLHPQTGARVEYVSSAPDFLRKITS